MQPQGSTPPGDDLAMTTEVEETAVATAVVNSTSRTLLALLRKRLRQLWKATLGLVIFTVLTAGVLATWWLTSLNGLPDIGDPFDVAAFRDFQIPDDQNAFTFLQRAQAKLTPLPELPQSARALTPTAGWSKLDPKLRAWVEANRPALELFQQAANQSDGVSQPAGDPYWWQSYRVVGPGGLIWLALLESGRRAESGDSAAAWDCYRTVLRMTTHLRRRGDMPLRYHANAVHTALRRRLATWAADPKTTIPQLRRALEESVETKPRPEWAEYGLRREYIQLMSLLDQSQNPIHMALEEDLSYRLGDMQVPTDLAVYVFAGRRVLLREPERSRRALRLLFANWLAHVAVPDLRQKRPAVRASFSSGKRNRTVPLYPMSSHAPTGARVLSPHEVASWLVTTIDAKQYFDGALWPSVRNQELMGYRQLVILLAEELYHRERGVLPPSEEALVGTYLQTLPDDGSADVGDGMTPTVTDSRGQP
jgi:hypothetical protein